MAQCRFYKTWVIGSCLIACLLFASLGIGQTLDNEVNSFETKIVSVSKAKSDWDNFVPPRDKKFDWIQLKSGEWLKGELKAFYNFVLQFDSDKLDLLKFDWEDIKQIRSAGLLRIRLERIDGNGRPFILIGTLVLVDDKATITVGNKVRKFDREQIVSMAKGAEREIDLWSGKISLGATFFSSKRCKRSSSLGPKSRKTRKSKSIPRHLNYQKT